MSEAADFCPYVGLQPFREQDRDYFFGRTRDQRIIISNLFASDLTIFYGASGVGKSSVLLAGVVPQLRLTKRVAVAVFRDWAKPDFLGEIKRVCVEAVRMVEPDAAGLDVSRPFDEILRLGAEAVKGRFLLIFDQFEDYLLYQPDADSGSSFDAELARVVNRPDIDAGILISLREDAVASLDRFRTRIPGVLSHTIRLGYLDKTSAEEAIRGPLRVYNERNPGQTAQIEDELVGAVMQEARERMSGTSGTGQAPKVAEVPIETALLQLLLTRIWRSESPSKQGVRTLRLETLRSQGGAAAIVERHLADMLTGLDGNQLEVCSRIFDRLVTPSGAKVACAERDLRRWSDDLVDALPTLLHRLSTGESRILRPISPSPGSDTGVLYEVFHDVLCGAVLNWRNSYLEQKTRAELGRKAEEQRQRAEEQERTAKKLRRILLAVGALAVVAIFAGAEALRYARNAREQSLQVKAQSRTASAMASAAEAFNQIQLDPELGAEVVIRAWPMFSQAPDSERIKAADELAQLLGAMKLRTTLKTGVSIQTVAPDIDQAGLLFLQDGKVIYPVQWPTGKTNAVTLQTSDSATIGAPSSDPTGRFLAATVDPTTVRLWDAHTGKTLRDLKLPSPVSAISFRQDGSSIAVVGNNDIGIWQIGSDTPELFKYNEFYVAQSVALHPRLPLLLTGRFDGEIQVWDLNSRNVTKRLRRHHDSVSNLQFSSDGKLLVSSSNDGTIRIWRVADWSLKTTFYGHENSVFSASFSPDGTKVVSSGVDATVRVWDTESGRELARLLSHSQPVAWAGFVDGGRTVLSADWGGVIKSWSAGGHADFVNAISFSPSGDIAASASDDHTVRVWDTVSGEELRILNGHADRVTSLRFSRDGARLISADAVGQVIVWNPKTGQRIDQFCCHKDARGNGVETISDFTVTSDGMQIVTIGMSSITLVDAAARTVQRLAESGYSFRKVAISPNDQLLLATTDDGILWSWRRSGTSWKLITKQTAHSYDIGALAVSPDSKRVITGDREGGAAIWTVNDQGAFSKPMFFPPLHNYVMDAAFVGKDASQAAVSTIRGAVFVWNSDGSGKAQQVEQHSNAASMWVSADHSRLMTYSWDRTANVWDTRSSPWKLITRLSQSDAINVGAISPDGKHMAVSVTNGRTQISPVDPGDLLEFAKTRVHRVLTVEECKRFLPKEQCSLH